MVLACLPARLITRKLVISSGWLILNPPNSCGLLLVGYARKSIVVDHGAGEGKSHCIAKRENEIGDSMRERTGKPGVAY
jgi:hypothetical protein